MNYRLAMAKLTEAGGLQIALGGFQGLSLSELPPGRF